MRTVMRLVRLSAVFGTAVLTLYIFHHDESNPSSTSKSKDDRIVDSPSRNPKKFLIWNLQWQTASRWNLIFQEITNRRCPQSNCKFTRNRLQLNSSDAVLFHLVDIAYEKYKFPKSRNPNQIWIGLNHEPPSILIRHGLNFVRLNGVFNRTMGYRTDGDIFSPEGTFLKIVKQHTPNISSSWVNSHDTISTRNYAEGKSRLVSWFVSSCHSQSKREKYVKELQNFIQVDVYGKCGPLKCGPRKTLAYPYKVEKDKCYKMVSMKYKFVLAFENSLCEDYVTEKLYNNLKLNVVPVVLGAANYSRFAPPHSVIEANRYTPKELAMYLQRLNKNDTEYNEYFRWKKDYQVVAHDGVPLVCSLCEQLHNPKWQMETKVYEQYDKWIMKGCRETYGKFQKTTFHKGFK